MDKKKTQLWLPARAPERVADCLANIRCALGLAVNDE